MKSYSIINKWKYPEYWDWKIIYFPVWIYILFKAIFQFKGRLFYATCINPRIDEYGGFAGTSKQYIQSLFPVKYIPKSLLIQEIENKINEAHAYISQLNFRAYLKPDNLERGIQVFKIENSSQWEDIIHKIKGNWIIQEALNVEKEFGVFVIKPPGQPLKITGITAKEFLKVIGDGLHNARSLLKESPRYQFCKKKLEYYSAERLNYIPKVGEEWIVESVGNHNRGTSFHDITFKKNSKMEAFFESIMPEGIHYGRFDLKCKELENLENGVGVKIIEFNGLLAEPVQMYDSKYSYWQSLSILFMHYKLQAQLAKDCAAKGYKIAGNWKGIKYLWDLKKREMV